MENSINVPESNKGNVNISTAEYKELLNYKALALDINDSVLFSINVHPNNNEVLFIKNNIFARKVYEIYKTIRKRNHMLVDRVKKLESNAITYKRLIRNRDEDSKSYDSIVEVLDELNDTLPKRFKRKLRNSIKRHNLNIQFDD